MDENNQQNNSAQQATPAAPSQEVDISKTTIAVLVLLTLMISVIGTWTVLNEISSVKIAQPSKPSSAVGEVKMVVINPADNLAATTGKVSLTLT
jgi:hypothetical protein